MYRGLSTTLGFRFVQLVSPAERAASYPPLTPDIRNNDHDVIPNIDSAFSQTGQHSKVQHPQPETTWQQKNSEITLYECIHGWHRHSAVSNFYWHVSSFTAHCCFHKPTKVQTHNTEIKRANLKTNECIINSKSHESCIITSVLFSQREFSALIRSWCWQATYIWLTSRNTFYENYVKHTCT